VRNWCLLFWLQKGPKGGKADSQSWQKKGGRSAGTIISNGIFGSVGLGVQSSGERIQLSREAQSICKGFAQVSWVRPLPGRKNLKKWSQQRRPCASARACKIDNSGTKKEQRLAPRRHEGLNPRANGTKGSRGEKPNKGYSHE